MIITAALMREIALGKSNIKIEKILEEILKKIESEAKLGNFCCAVSFVHGYDIRYLIVEKLKHLGFSIEEESTDYLLIGWFK